MLYLLQALSIARSAYFLAALFRAHTTSFQHYFLPTLLPGTHHLSCTVSYLHYLQVLTPFPPTLFPACNTPTVLYQRNFLFSLFPAYNVSANIAIHLLYSLSTLIPVYTTSCLHCFLQAAQLLPCITSCLCCSVSILG
jgi:hypothetical protein